MSVLFALLATVSGIALVGFGVFWVGFQTVPASHPDLPLPKGTSPFFPRPGNEGDTRALPEDLPAPLAEFFQGVFGELTDRREIPELTSAVIWGRGRYRLFGFMVPMRFRSIHRPGESFYRTIEVTWFGRPVLRVREHFADGSGSRRVEGWATAHDHGPSVSEALRQTLWREAFWAPSALLKAPWKPASARSWSFPEADFEVVFDTRSRRPTRIDGRHPAAARDAKGRWRASLTAWNRFHGIEIPTQVWVRNPGGPEPDTLFVAQGVAYHVDLPGDLRQAHRHLHRGSPERES